MKTSLEIFKEIESFRTKNQKCLSTTHTMTIGDYQKVFPMLVDKYKKFTVEINTIQKPTEPVSVTIDTNIY